MDACINPIEFWHCYRKFLPQVGVWLLLDINMHHCCEKCKKMQKWLLKTISDTKMLYHVTYEPGFVVEIWGLSTDPGTDPGSSASNKSQQLHNLLISCFVSQSPGLFSSTHKEWTFYWTFYCFSNWRGNHILYPCMLMVYVNLMKEQCLAWSEYMSAVLSNTCPWVPLIIVDIIINCRCKGSNNKNCWFAVTVSKHLWPY